MCNILTEVNWTAVSAISTVAGTIIVAWYSWETHKLRKLTQSQFDAMSAAVQTHFMITVEPLIDLKSPLRLTIHNHGGPARIIVASSDLVLVETQSSLVLPGSHQHWSITSKTDTNWGHSMDFDYAIYFEDQHGVSHERRYRKSGDSVTAVDSTGVKDNMSL